MVNAPFDFPDPEDYARVRSVFERAGYTDEHISEALRTEGLTAVGVKRLPPLLRRTAGGTPLETLIRLFILGVTLEREVVQRALVPMDVEHWVDLGLLEAAGEGVRAAIQV